MSQDTTSLDVESIENARIPSLGTVGRDATVVHYAFMAYFDGSDVTGAINSQSKRLLAALTAVLRGKSAQSALANTAKAKAELRAELEAALIESGYGSDENPYPFDVSTTSAGPMLGTALAACLARGADPREADGFDETTNGTLEAFESLVSTEDD